MASPLAILPRLRIPAQVLNVFYPHTRARCRARDTLHKQGKPDALRDPNEVTLGSPAFLDLRIRGFPPLRYD